MVSRFLPAVVDTKYENILTRERKLAKAVARRVVKLPDVTVWAFMVPLIFLFNFLRYKRATEAFTLNFLFTKKLALEAALDVVKKGHGRQEALDRIHDKTTNILSADKRGIYSEKIRRKQMMEINLLLDHYIRLLEAEGKSYEAMMENTYQSIDNYQAFLRELALAEKSVNLTALQTVERTKEAQDMISEMEEAAQSLRTEQAEKIFS